MTRRTLGREYHVVADCEMSRNSGLTSEDYSIPNVRAAGESYLRTQKRVFTNCA